MKRLATIAVLVLLAVGCDEAADPTATSETPSVQTNQAAPEGAINQLVADLFPASTAGEAHRLFAEMKSALARSDSEAARSSMFDLLALAEETELEDPSGATTTAEAHAELIDVLFAFVGLEAPEVDPAILSGETDGVVQVAFPDQDNLIVTPAEFAGTFIEQGDLDEETLVVVERLEPDQQAGGDCLPLAVDQREGCYRFEKFPEITFQDEVLVAVCPVPGIRDETDPASDQFQLARFDPENPGDGVIFLPSASESFLDCSGFDALARADGSTTGLGLLARAGERAAGPLLGWLLPAPAEAVNLGFGGSTVNFSRIGWARPLAVEIVFPEPAETGAPAGQPVDVGVRVINPHAPVQPAPLVGGVEVTFSVVEGGGSVAPATVTTDAQGSAVTDWTLGQTVGATNTLRIAIPGDTIERSLTGEIE